MKRLTLCTLVVLMAYWLAIPAVQTQGDDFDDWEIKNNIISTFIPPRVTAQWWQWALSIPSAVHPLKRYVYPEGEEGYSSNIDYSMIGQQRNYWFL